VHHKSDIFQKIEKVGATIGALKGAWDVGKQIYTFGQAAAPYVARGLQVATAMI
jgi:hypothetical protein